AVRVVHEDVYGAPALGRLGDHRLDLRVVADVAHGGVRLAAGVADGGDGALGAMPLQLGDADLRTLACEHGGDGRADALAGAGDDGAPAVGASHQRDAGPSSAPGSSSQRLSARVRISLVRIVCSTARRTRCWT